MSGGRAGVSPGPPGDDSSRLEAFWDSRYRDFSLSESGWAGAGERHNALIYRCKAAAVSRALRAAGLNHDARFAVLDAGCGQGFFADFYARRFPHAQYTGIDLSSRAVAHLGATRPGGTFVHADLASWSPAADARFDVIQCLEVFHLMLDDARVSAALANFRRLLSSGGCVLVTAALPVRTEERGGYLRFRSRRQFTDMVARAGLAIAAEAPMYYWLPDRGPTWTATRPLFHRTPSSVLYALDRLALRLRLPRVPTGPDSRMRLLTLVASP